MSDAPGSAPAGWGPRRLRAAVSVTFDNLGEAADLERGLWPADKPLGNHFSVRRVLPRILDLLDETGIRATFFVEGLNARLYPDELAGIVDRGHDLGYHGWRHEYWAGLSPSEEARLLERGVREMEKAGLRPRGFRPPGGRLNTATLGLLKEWGFDYCSPAGRGVGVLEEVVVLPFDWRLIDAYYYLPRFGELRRADTGSAKPLPPPRFGQEIRTRLERTVRDGDHVSLLFHPFLEERKDRFRVLQETLETLRSLTEEGAAWCAPYGEIAPWVREHSKDLDSEPSLDHTET